MKYLKKIPLFLLAVIINLCLFLLIPLLQVLLNKAPHREKERKAVERVETVIQKKIQKIQKKELKTIRTLVRNYKPTSPMTRTVSLNLSVAEGGEGVAIEAGGVGQQTWDPNDVDVEARIRKEADLTIPLRARREEVSGYVDVIAVINESGYAIEVEVVIESPQGYGFAKEAIKSIKAMGFYPATIEKVPVRQTIKRRFLFDVE